MTPDRFAPIRRVVLAYAVVSFLWILLSDRAVDLLFPDHDAHLMAQTWKGWLFVGVTTGLLYLGLKRLYRQLMASTDDQVELSLREARTAALLHALVDASSDAIFAKDHEGRYLLFNRAAERLLNKSAGEVLGNDDSALFPPEQAALVRTNDQKSMRLDRPETFEELLDTFDGPRTFLATKGPLRGVEGVVGTFGISRDISEMVAARQRLQDGERRYRAMFELNPVPMFVVDLQSQRFLAVNEAAVAHYGFDREAFLRLTLSDIRPPEGGGQLHEFWRSVEASDRPQTIGPVAHWTRDRRVIEVNLSLCDVEFDGRLARLVLIDDVTNKNRMQKERDTALTRLNNILSRVTDGFMAVSPDQHLTYVNRQAAAFIDPEADPQSLVGRLVWDLVPGAVGTRYEGAFFNAMAEERSIVVEDWFDPWQRWIECRIYPSSQGASVYFTDISERKLAEQALERSQKDLSALAARLMSQEQATNQRIAQALHDQLGQQLGSARLYLDLVQAALENGKEVAPGLVAKSVELVSGAIAEVRHVLLDLRPPLLKEQGLAAALDNELRNSPAGGLGVHMLMDACEDVWGRRWPEEVEYAAFMVAREAIANAMQHAQARSVTVSLDGDTGFLCMRVEDDGLGIPIDACDGVPGHLGIVGMRERAQAVGGHLTVSPRSGGGTLVDLTIEELTA
jgi:PAS domain S-box-containing protein